MMPLLLAFGLLAANPVDCTRGVIVLDTSTARCISPAEANGYLASAGGAQRIDVGTDGRAVVVPLLAFW